MANGFSKDILIQAEDLKGAAAFYIEQLGFVLTDETPEMISIQGDGINLFIERGPKLGPVLEVTVADVEEAKARLVAAGCQILKDEPEFPRCYVMDPLGLVFNLRQQNMRP